MKFHFWPVHLVAVTVVTSITLWRRLCGCCITSAGMWIQARCLIRDQRIRLYVYVCFYLSWKKDQLLWRRCSLSQAPAESSSGQFSAPFWSCLDFNCRLTLKNIISVQYMKLPPNFSSCDRYLYQWNKVVQQDGRLLVNIYNKWYRRDPRWTEQGK